MDQPLQTRLPTDASRALMFTDARGQVVFVDSNFVRMMGRSSGENVVGVPMHELLGIELEAAQKLLRQISQNGQLKHYEIELRDASGAPLPVSCTGLATYDDRRSFIGADLTLIRSNAPTPVSPPLYYEPPVEAVPEDTPEPASAALQQEYFIAQMTALRELVARVGGNHLRQVFNTIVNDTAAQNEWPITIQNERFYAEVHRDHVEVYRGLLAKAVTYAITVIGAKLVAKEINSVDQQMEAATVEAGQPLALRDLLA